MKKEDKAKYNRQYYIDNKDKIKEQMKQYRAEHKEQKKQKRLKLKYNLSPDNYNQLFKAAEFQCQICGSKERLYIDHNHTTNQIRGILCHNCNTALGMVKDDTSILLKMIEYLEGAKI